MKNEMITHVMQVKTECIYTSKHNYFFLILVEHTEQSDKVTSFGDAFNKLTALEEFSRRIEYTPMLEKLLELRTLMEKRAVTLTKKQKKIEDFFK